MSIQKKVNILRKAWAEGDAKRDANLKEPEDLIKYRDLSYGPYGEASLLDVYRPDNREGEKLPVLINVHGGGFFYGDKNLYRFYAMDMARFGFAVVNINYRLSPENHFPAPLEDINEVMNWIEKHAEEYFFDLNRIFMMGDSAGAQLTCNYAAINSNPEYAKLYPFTPNSLKIKKIVTACGMYDVVRGMKMLSRRLFYKAYLQSMKNRKDPIFDVLGAITDKYPETFAFSAPNDFLFKECEPYVNLINERGGRAESKIYGTKEQKEICHVFHLNFAFEIGAVARKDEAEFLLR